MSVPCGGGALATKRPGLEAFAGALCFHKLNDGPATTE